MINNLNPVFYGWKFYGELCFQVYFPFWCLQQSYEVGTIIPFYTWGHWGIEKTRLWPKGMHFQRCRARILILLGSVANLYHLCLTFFLSAWLLSIALGTIKGVRLEKKMATHSSVLAWRIPEMAEPGGLQSMASYRVGQAWNNSSSTSKAVRRYLPCIPNNTSTCHMRPTEGLSHTYPCIHSPPRSPPMQAASQHWQFSVLCSRTLLVIHFKHRSVYKANPNSQTIPALHPSPLAATSSFSKSVSRFLFYK